MKMIVGLGNPGTQYRSTRHNLGFSVVDHVAERLGVQFGREKCNGLLAEASFDGDRLLLVKPLTFMNRSGDCVAPLARNGVRTLEDLLVVVDDVNLPLGRVRFRPEGSAGGHNGLKSLVERLGSEAFPRLRLGVGDDRAVPELAGHVLGKFRPDEWPMVSKMTPEAAEAVLCWATHGIERAMNDYNR